MDIRDPIMDMHICIKGKYIWKFNNFNVQLWVPIMQL